MGAGTDIETIGKWHTHTHTHIQASICPFSVTVLWNTWVHTAREVTVNRQEIIIYKDRQFTCKVTLRPVRLTVVLVDKQ